MSVLSPSQSIEVANSCLSPSTLPSNSGEPSVPDSMAARPFADGGLPSDRVNFSHRQTHTGGFLCDL
ncbi:ATP-NAD kinase family protein [Anopheles sinensis]|uniref:ATP-NAD kinase family protein n=1 Tax=Anopheles sinensis TaxID=74873 RepID=A0A084WD79_ANOSI|nr:ATP-NAD kinase family protein [Anopheles sinensis]